MADRLAALDGGGPVAAVGTIAPNASAVSGFVAGAGVAGAARRGLQPPPVFLACAIVAMLLAILAAAQPRVKLTSSGAEVPIAILVDRGLTMSALSGTEPRFVDTTRQAIHDLGELASGNTKVDLITIPGDEARRVPLAQVEAAVNALAPNGPRYRCALE